MRSSLILFLIVVLNISLSAQKKSLEYYLGEDKYESSIPTPERFLGYMPGEWHISHHELVGYLKELGSVSENAKFVEFGKSYENRPLTYLIVSSKENLKNIDQIKKEHKNLTDPTKSADLNTSKMPVVVYQGYSIHGNEPSGANAVPLLAYKLLASKSKEVEQLLKDAVILIDPCFNPDGFNRFASWVNSHQGKNLNGDGQSREYNEPWPRGRTNHYWFDLNRDWLPAQHPESQGRVANFHEWKPNILTDHHEMGSNSTFFFQPGIPQRTNPNTPQLNQDLTEEIGNYHAEALDNIGSLYFTKEAFDDYYYGKGSTYPDINGSIGILFEQASSRGHFQETENGPMDFAFTIKNQLVTSLSTLEAAKNMRVKLLNYQRDFYKEAQKMAENDDDLGYVFTMKGDHARASNFIEMLERHQIDIHEIKQDISTKNGTFYQYDSYFIPFAQNQYRLIKAAFEYRTTFKDSIFYDVSAFNLANAFGAEFEPVEKREKAAIGKKIQSLEQINPAAEIPEYSDYGYLIEWNQYYAPAALYEILANDLRVKVANLPFTMDGKKEYKEGTLFVPVSNQKLNPQELYSLLESVNIKYNIKITEIYTGLSPMGPDLGSRNFSLVKKPNILILGGSGVSSYDAGEVWHLLDQVYNIPSSLITLDNISRADLSKYNVIIMPNGSYNGLGISGKNKLEKWASSRNNTIVAYGNALKWLASNNMGTLSLNSSISQQSPAKRPYNMLSRDRGSNVIGGAILNISVDLSHPIFYGYEDNSLKIFRKGNVFLKQPSNKYACPAFYGENPLTSGYASAKNIKLLSNSPAIIGTRFKSSTIICFADNPNFRAFWHNTQKLSANAIFFGSTINRGALE
jgi:hypothetical protein